MNGYMVKNDFENLFLACEGIDFTLSRCGSVVGTVRGLLQKKQIQFKAESNICTGDLLRCDLKDVSFCVDKIGYEIVGGIRTVLLANVHEV